jgi:acyl dehydratase
MFSKRTCWPCPPWRYSGTPLCELDGASMVLDAGGYGGPRGTPPAKVPMPDRPIDHIRDLETLPQAALIDRLSGDYNPVHADPALARRAGFDRPILHGRCSVAARSTVVLDQGQATLSFGRKQ